MNYSILVFLKIQNVTIRLVFIDPLPVTYVDLLSIVNILNSSLQL